MNQLAQNTERLPMDSVGMSTGSTGAKIAPQNLAEVVKFAEVMCRADIALPKHLRGNAGACMAVSLQALDWQMNPFAVASKSYSVNGTIAYEAQLIAAVVNTRSGIKGRLKYTYDGEGATLTCTVTGILDGEEYSYTSPPMGAITTKNSPLWKTDPQQQLGYYSARSWARRYTPEVILGVYDREEAESFQGADNAKDITPSRPSVMDRLRANTATQEPTSEREGFNASSLHAEPETALTGEIITDTDETDNAPSGQSSVADEPATPSAAADEVDPPSPASSAATNDRDDETNRLIQFAKDVLPMAGDPTTTGAALSVIEKEWAEEIKKMSPAGQEKAKGISRSMRAIFNGQADVDAAVSFHAEGLGCEPDEIGGE